MEFIEVELVGQEGLNRLFALDKTIAKVVQNEGIAWVLELGVGGADSIRSYDIALILDCSCTEEAFPSDVSGLWPIGRNEE